VSRERMAEGVAGGPFRDPAPADGFLHRPLHGGLVQVMAPSPTGLRIRMYASRWKHPLPGPLAAGIRVFPLERGGQHHPSGAGPQVLVVLIVHDL
jgi:hypothetical protein